MRSHQWQKIMKTKTPLPNKTKCLTCEGSGIIYSKWDIGNFDLCDRCEGTGYLCDRANNKGDK